jgi:N6-L-threonylcarbamoyladenine synthase
MLILGIETSCDETAAAVAEDGWKLRSSVLASQTDLHHPYGGVVPELASRRHIEMVDRIVGTALSKADCRPKDLDAVSVTNGPGLAGALLVGTAFARALSYGLKVPLMFVNHLEGHIASVFIERRDINFPSVILVVSGGHTNLYYVKGYGECRLLGQTRDDAAGEAFDKAAKMLGLGYPGGPVIDRLARLGDPAKVRFPRAYLAKGSLDFSFSGLKTALLYYLQKRRNDAELKDQIPDLVAGFQEAIVDVLVTKTFWAAEKYNTKTVGIAGGVAANTALRSKMADRAKKSGMQLRLPSLKFCTDNAAMIALAGYHQHLRAQAASQHGPRLSLDASSKLLGYIR